MKATNNQIGWAITNGYKTNDEIKFFIRVIIPILQEDYAKCLAEEEAAWSNR